MSLRKLKQKLSPKIEVIIPKNVNDQIKYLCQEIRSIEWSGVLFYTMDGSITDPKNLKITLQEILPLDVGTAGATSYEIGIDVVKYMIANDAEEKGWKIGHIHSHHNMGVFFSGTDDSELQDNSENHNLYLSVIVNNKHDIIGKVGITATSNLPEDTQELGYIALDENGEEYAIESIIAGNDKKFFEYDCEIKFAPDVIEVSDEFKALREKMKTHSGNYTGEYGYGRGTNPRYRGYGSSNIYGAQTEEDDEWDLIHPYSGRSQYNRESGFQPKTTSLTIEEKAAEFAFQLLCDEDEDALKLSNLQDVVEYYVAMDFSGAILAKNMLNKYPGLVDQIFPKDGDTIPPVYYIIRKTIEAYTELYEKKNKEVFNLLDPIIARLKAKQEFMLKKV